MSMPDVQALAAEYDAALEAYRADPANAEAKVAMREAAAKLDKARSANQPTAEDLQAAGVVVAPDAASAGSAVGEE